MNTVVGTDLQAIYKEARSGDVKDSQADITKARTLLATRRSSGSKTGCATRSGAWRRRQPLST
jgi:hypothetical protein